MRHWRNLTVLANVLVLAGCTGRQPNSLYYIPPKPRVGDAALYSVKLLKPTSLSLWRHPTRPLGARDYTYHRVLIECGRVTRSHVAFRVYYPKGDERGPLVYRLSVDYSADDFSSRTKVRDAKGRVVTRGHLVGGLPVLFESFLFFDAKYLGAAGSPGRKRLALREGTRVVLKREDADQRDGLWPVFMIWDGKDLSYTERQVWYANEWLWRQLRRNSDRLHCEARLVTFMRPGSE